VPVPVVPIASSGYRAPRGALTGKRAPDVRDDNENSDGDDPALHGEEARVVPVTSVAAFVLRASSFSDSLLALADVARDSDAEPAELCDQLVSVLQLFPASVWRAEPQFAVTAEVHFRDMHGSTPAAIVIPIGWLVDAPLIDQLARLLHRFVAARAAKLSHPIGNTPADLTRPQGDGFGAIANPGAVGTGTGEAPQAVWAVGATQLVGGALYIRLGNVFQGVEVPQPALAGSGKRPKVVSGGLLESDMSVAASRLNAQASHLVHVSVREKWLGQYHPMRHVADKATTDQMVRGLIPHLRGFVSALGAAAPAGAVGAARVGEVSVYDLRYMLDEYVALNKYLFGDADQLVRELVRTVSTELVYLLETRPREFLDAWDRAADQWNTLALRGVGMSYAVSNGRQCATVLPSFSGLVQSALTLVACERLRAPVVDVSGGANVPRVELKRKGNQLCKYDSQSGGCRTEFTTCRYKHASRGKK
jgi:hypothetical protein